MGPQMISTISRTELAVTEVYHATYVWYSIMQMRVNRIDRWQYNDGADRIQTDDPRVQIKQITSSMLTEQIE